MTIRRTGILCAIWTVACAGCGAGHTSRRATAPATAPPIARAEATHEYPSPPPPRQIASKASATAVVAIRTFANAYINWNAQTVSQNMRTLAARSVGQARAAMTLASAETAGDYELRRGGIANQGTVEAVARLPRRKDEYVVVTLESTTATNTTAYQGLRPAWHVALATVAEQRAGQWVLSGWQPEN